MEIQGDTPRFNMISMTPVIRELFIAHIVKLKCIMLLSPFLRDDQGQFLQGEIDLDKCSLD